jgi:hypothetical protein
MQTASRKTGRSFSTGYVENSLEFGKFYSHLIPHRLRISVEPKASFPKMV